MILCARTRLVAQKSLCGSRKLRVSHETQFRDLGRGFICKYGAIWLSTGFLWFKGSSEKKLSINFGCVVSKNQIWFTISKFWVLFFNFEWTLWYYVDFFFGFCYIILYWKLETDYPMRDGSRCNYVKYTSFPISFDLYFILFITKERLSCKMMFLTVQTTDNRLNYNL